MPRNPARERDGAHEKWEGGCFQGGGVAGGRNAGKEDEKIHVLEGGTRYIVDSDEAPFIRGGKREGSGRERERRTSEGGDETKKEGKQWRDGGKEGEERSVE